MAYQQHQSSAADVRARCAIITLSDTRTLETDTSGKKIADLLSAHGHPIVHRLLLKDDPGPLQAAMDQLIASDQISDQIDAILTTGGTGISRRDQAIDVIERQLDRALPGFGELFRMLSYEQIGSGAMLSRAIGGIGRGKLIFGMPGSTAAVELAMTKLILPELGHLVWELRK